MKKSQLLSSAVRVVFGLVFVVFGLNGFLHFIPQPPLAPGAGAFIGGLASTGYFFPLLKGLEVAAGVALLANVFVPLALTVLAPIVVNVAAFHLFLAPGAMPMLVFLTGAEIYLAIVNRAAFAPLLRARPGLREPVSLSVPSPHRRAA